MLGSLLTWLASDDFLDRLFMIPRDVCDDDSAPLIHQPVPAASRSPITSPASASRSSSFDSFSSSSSVDTSCYASHNDLMKCAEMLRREMFERRFGAARHHRSRAIQDYIRFENDSHIHQRYADSIARADGFILHSYRGELRSVQAHIPLGTQLVRAFAWEEDIMNETFCHLFFRTGHCDDCVVCDQYRFEQNECIIASGMSCRSFDKRTVSSWVAEGLISRCGSSYSVCDSSDSSSSSMSRCSSTSCATASPVDSPSATFISDVAALVASPISESCPTLSPRSSRSSKGSVSTTASLRLLKQISPRLSKAEIMPVTIHAELISYDWMLLESGCLSWSQS